MVFFANIPDKYDLVDKGRLRKILLQHMFSVEQSSV